MSSVKVDADVKILLEKHRREGETLNDVIKRLLYRELKDPKSDLNKIEKIDEKTWKKLTSETLDEYHDILEKLAE